MSRQHIARSSLAVLAPICLLAMAALADRIFHHAPPPVAQPLARARAAQRIQVIVAPAVPVASAPPQTTLELLHEIRRSCPHPERADGCSPLTLTARLAPDMPAIRAHYREIEERTIARLLSGDYVPIHALGFLRSRRALPTLREMLLSEDSPTDWRTAGPNEPAIYYADEQYPRHRALIQAIESIEGLPIRDAFKLTRAEHRLLSARAARCFGDTAAEWLLHKLAGAPLPTSAEIRAHDRACHARVIRG